MIDYGKCTVCDAKLLQRDGFLNSGLCGPCCLGEADAVYDVSVPCEKCEADFQRRYLHTHVRVCPRCAPTQKFDRD